MTEFAKPFKTFQEQIDILKKRGLVVENEQEAIALLSKYNYYRLSGYSLTLRKNDKFYPEVTFSNIIDIYGCDMAMRKVLFYLLDDVEINLRTKLSYYFAKKYGPLGYLNKENFIDETFFPKFQSEYLKEIDRNAKSERFLNHYKEQYNSQYPIWILVEALPFGMVSRLYSNLASEIRKEIASGFNAISERYLKNWLQGLVILRNICAHRGRIFNRPLPYALKLPKNYEKAVEEKGLDINAENKSVFVYLLILKMLISSKKVWQECVQELVQISSQYSFVDLKHYGFWDNWQKALE